MNRTEGLDSAYANWTVQNNQLSDAHGAIVSLKGGGGTGHKILKNDISRGGQLGIAGTGRYEVISGNKIHHNNTEDFNWEWEAGGLKTVHAEDVTVDSNEFYSNRGNAIWFDYECRNNTISNNRMHHNARRGIHYEMSEYGKIYKNVLWENGWSTPGRSNKGAGIGISNSKNVEAYSNTLAWNADGIGIWGQNRDGTAWDNVYNIYVHDNTILAKDYSSDPKDNFALAWMQVTGYNQMFDPANKNRGANNKYWYPNPESSLVRYEWNRTGYGKLAAFYATPGEENGRYLTGAEKDQVVSSARIPSSPESR